MASITKRKDSWFVQIRRKGFRPRFRSFSSHSEAVRWARIEEGLIDNGSGRGDSKEAALLTVGELLARYSDEVSTRKKGVESERLRIERMREAPFAALRASDLTPAAVAAFRNDRLELVKPATVRRELGILRRALEVARTEWAVPLRGNPVSLIRLPAARDARERRISPLEFRNLTAALKASRNPHMSPLVTLALETALRRGELLRLRWGDIDLGNRKALIRDTKNGSDRTIPLTKLATATLEGLKRNGPQVFPITGDALRQCWSRACKRAAIQDLRFHDLRHEAISRLFELGLSVPEVALVSGHKDARMLFRYTHLLPDQVRDRIDKLATNR